MLLLMHLTWHYDACLLHIMPWYALGSELSIVSNTVHARVLLVLDSPSLIVCTYDQLV